MTMVRILAVLVCVALTACESTPTRLLTYGSQGTEIQAMRLVAQVYGKPADPLPYGGPEIDPPLARMQSRWNELRPLLDQGVLGLTEDGHVDVRDAEALDAAGTRHLRSLVRAENFDRHLLYRGMCAAVGYGTDLTASYLPFTEDTFGTEWGKQAQAGWWLRDHKGRWSRKE